MNKEDKLSANLEGYLKAIYLITRTDAEAHPQKLKEHLQVSGPSVTQTLQLLSQKRLVNYNFSKGVILSPQGENAARNILNRHETLREFFIDVLGIDAELAEEGACTMEHVASANIIRQMGKYTQFLKTGCKERKGHTMMFSFDDYLKREGEEGQDTVP